ncbi:MAG TPA: carbohydrate porin, partial [Candidatus Sulfotelmatobacter sp.]|nr:carbohydrate porin [Candidatus Sulfotelmatobacter sp.]
MEEVAYRLNQGKDAQGLASTFKLGAWAGAGSRFPDQRFDTTGRSLADPLSNGIPRSHASDYGLYGIVDQTLWQAGGGDQRRLAAFARVGGSPSAQNLIDFYSDGGLTYQGLLPERQNDVVGVGVIYSRIGAAARGLDLDARSFGDPGHLVRSGEVAIETTYQIQLAPWWTLQPDLQYIIHPGGTIAPPGTASNSPIPNALVIGLRTTLKL